MLAAAVSRAYTLASLTSLAHFVSLASLASLASLTPLTSLSSSAGRRSGSWTRCRRWPPPASRASSSCPPALRTSPALSAARPAPPHSAPPLAGDCAAPVLPFPRAGLPAYRPARPEPRVDARGPRRPVRCPGSARGPHTTSFISCNTSSFNQIGRLSAWGIGPEDHFRGEPARSGRSEAARGVRHCGRARGAPKARCVALQTLMLRPPACKSGDREQNARERSKAVPRTFRVRSENVPRPGTENVPSHCREPPAPPLFPAHNAPHRTQGETEGPQPGLACSDSSPPPPPPPPPPPSRRRRPADYGHHRGPNSGWNMSARAHSTPRRARSLSLRANGRQESGPARPTSSAERLGRAECLGPAECPVLVLYG